MNILLISPNTLTIPYPVYPLGLDYVAAAVPTGHRVQIVDLNATPLEELERLLAREKQDIVALSCRNVDNTDASASTSYLEHYRRLIRWLRTRTEAIIVCGGSGFTLMPAAMLEILQPDYGIVGEGERFGLLVQALARGEDPLDLEGVLAPGCPDELPPAWGGTPVRRMPGTDQHTDYYLQHGGMLNLQTKRGCIFRCIYCPYPRIEGQRQRLISPAQVARTARGLQEAGARYLFFTDSAFNADIDHSLHVARALRQARVRIPWGGFFAPIRLPADYFESMARAGLTHVEFGSESLCDQMLTTLHKPFTSADVFRAHQQARQAGIHTAHYFLFGGPGESADTVRQSLDLIDRLEKAALFFFIGIRIYPHTKLYTIALERGKISRDTDLLQPVFYRPAAIDRTCMTRLVSERAAGRINWIIGSGGHPVARIVARMHQRGRTGPLWEYLIR